MPTSKKVSFLHIENYVEGEVTHGSGTQTQEIRLTARAYRVDGQQPRPITLTARFDPTRPELKRYVLVEGQMAGDEVHPYTHDLEVEVEFRGTMHRFFVFVKRHKRLPINQSLAALSEAGVRGDLLVVACGPKAGARGIRSGEARAADMAVEQYVKSMVMTILVADKSNRAIPCFTIPSNRRIPRYWPRRRRGRGAGRG